MTEKRPLSPWVQTLGSALGLLLALSLLAACESAKSTPSSAPSEEEYRDQVTAYCEAKAQQERQAFVKQERSLRKPERDLGVRARQVFNQAFALCLESYDLPRSSSSGRPAAKAPVQLGLRLESETVSGRTSLFLTL
ncbi:MAG: hypothetical protein J4G10_01480 [Alphaproteobacteria bacterium]|nr:hypothetical protein [Alphaproteobacteria bacterium]